MTYLGLLYYAADYSLHFYKQYRFIKKFLEPLVDSFAGLLNYQLNPMERGKTFRYYPLLSVCALAETYTLLKGRGLTEIERKRVTLMSAMATLCDDLIDEDGWTEQQLLDLLDSKIPYSSLPVKAKLIVSMNEEFKRLQIPNGYWDQLRKAFHGQADSIRQHQPDLSLEDTLLIAREKNGNYCLAVAFLLDEDWSDLDKAIIYQHGIIGQIGNDVYDSYKDIHQDIYTVVRKVNNISQLRSIFITECSKIQELIMQLNCNTKRKKHIIRKLTCIDAFTLYGINQLQDAENKYGQPIDWPSVTRKELIIDMEINANRWKYIQGAIRLSKEVERKLFAS